MIRDEIKQLKTGPGDLRKFGFLVGGVLAALGLYLWIRGRAWFPWLLAPGAALLVLGALAPRALKHVYIAWMSLAIVLGFIVSNVILALFFFLVITPVGLVARLSGRDFLNRKLDRAAATYWLPRRRSAPRAAADYERQF